MNRYLNNEYDWVALPIYIAGMAYLGFTLNWGVPFCVMLMDAMYRPSIRWGNRKNTV